MSNVEYEEKARGKDIYAHDELNFLVDYDSAMEEGERDM